MTRQEREKIAENIIRDLVKIHQAEGEAVPSQLRHALSAVNGNATINGKPERVGLDRAFALIERCDKSDRFSISIEIEKK